MEEWLDQVKVSKEFRPVILRRRTSNFPLSACIFRCICIDIKKCLWSGCEDSRGQCGYFSNFDGYCQYHYGFMLTYCPRSCDFCGKNEFWKLYIRGTETGGGALSCKNFQKISMNFFLFHFKTDDVSLPESPVQKATTEKPTSSKYIWSINQQIKVYIENCFIFLHIDEGEITTTPFEQGNVACSVDEQMFGCVQGIEFISLCNQRWTRGKANTIWTWRAR
jgi:hypothetical protein